MFPPAAHREAEIIVVTRHGVRQEIRWPPGVAEAACIRSESSEQPRQRHSNNETRARHRRAIPASLLRACDRGFQDNGDSLRHDPLVVDHQNGFHVSMRIAEYLFQQCVVLRAKLLREGDRLAARSPLFANLLYDRPTLRARFWREERWFLSSSSARNQSSSDEPKG